MKKLIVAIAFAAAGLVSSPVAASGAAETVQHYKGKPAETLPQAVANFSEYNRKLKALLDGPVTDADMAEVHQLTYTLENALKKINEEMAELADTLEKVHQASEKLDRDAVSNVFIELWRTQHAIAHSPVPVIIGLTGHSPAGGTVLAIHGDYRVMALGDYRMGLNEVQVGLLPGGPIHGAFKRLVGGHASQLLTRGALIDPASALRIASATPTMISRFAAEISGWRRARISISAFGGG